MGQSCLSRLCRAISMFFRRLHNRCTHKKKTSIQLDEETYKFCIPPRRSSSMTTDSYLDNISTTSSTVDDFELERSSSVDMKEKPNLRGPVLGGVVPTLGIEPSLYSIEEVSGGEGEEVSSSSDDGSFYDDRQSSFGNLHFTTTFDEQRNRLIVYLDKATELPCKGLSRTYDTVVRLCLVPYGKSFRTSQAIKNTLNPHFQEDFLFQLDKRKDLRKLRLRLSVFDNDRQGRHDALGHCLLPLASLVPGQEVRHNTPIKPMYLITSSLGYLLLSLCYFPSQDRLSVVIFQARNIRVDSSTVKSHLRFLARTDSYDTYVKVTLMCGGEKVRTQRTDIVYGSRAPTYNQTFHFVLPLSFLDDASVLTTVMVKGPFKRDIVLGRTLSGPFIYSHGEKLTHWGHMLLERRAVCRWRTLLL